MGAYADVYLNDVVEVQGKLFDFFAQKSGIFVLFIV